MSQPLADGIFLSIDGGQVMYDTQGRKINIQNDQWEFQAPRPNEFRPPQPKPVESKTLDPKVGICTELCGNYCYTVIVRRNWTFTDMELVHLGFCASILLCLLLV